MYKRQAPEDILKQYGADVMRLWVASSDYRQDMRISKDMLKHLSQNYLKIRNTARYILGNLFDFDPKPRKYKAHSQHQLLQNNS